MKYLPVKIHRVSALIGFTCWYCFVKLVNREERANIWAVKCMPCMPLCTRPFRGFVPAVGANRPLVFIICFS